jgi:hypothetical protein
MVSVTLVIEEEECLVSLLVDARDVHRASQGNTKLIAMRNRFQEPVQVIEIIIVRVEGRIAQIIVHVPCNWLPPDLVTTLITFPVLQPYCAENVFC